MSTVTKLTLDQYEQMIADGAFAGSPRSRLELIEGEIREMSPIGPPHSEIVDLLNDWSARLLPITKVRVRVQQPIRLPLQDSEPEPDITWVHKKNYSRHHPEPREVYLLIEVAETSLVFDRNEKSRLYAEAGIAEYWIVDVASREILVYRPLDSAHYHAPQVFDLADEIHPLAFPQVTLPVKMLFEDFES